MLPDQLIGISKLGESFHEIGAEVRVFQYPPLLLIVLELPELYHIFICFTMGCFYDRMVIKATRSNKNHGDRRGIMLYHRLFLFLLFSLSRNLFAALAKSAASFCVFS